MTLSFETVIVLNMKFIGICGYANSGKDFLCEVLKDYYKGSRISLGDFVKENCRTECLNRFGVDPTNCSREDKNKIRHFLVSFGESYRRISHGTYFTKLADNKINRLQKHCDTFVVSDIRFNCYPKDEAAWLLSKPNSILIHIERGGICAPNLTEKLNLPKVIAKADLNIMPPKFVNSKNKNKDFLDFLISSGTIDAINERLGINSASKELRRSDCSSRAN
mgnify:FL=1